MQTEKYVGRPIVVGTDGSARARANIRDAAELAALDNASLHIVAAYALSDDLNHRLARVSAPRDVCHDLTGRGDAYADAHDARRLVAHAGLDVHIHVLQGTLNHTVERVAREVRGGMVALETRKPRRFARLWSTSQRQVPGVPVIALEERS